MGSCFSPTTRADSSSIVTRLAIAQCATSRRRRFRSTSHATRAFTCALRLRTRIPALQNADVFLTAEGEEFQSGFRRCAAACGRNPEGGISSMISLRKYSVRFALLGLLGV